MRQLSDNYSNSVGSIISYIMNFIFLMLFISFAIDNVFLLLLFAIVVILFLWKYSNISFHFKGKKIWYDSKFLYVGEGKNKLTIPLDKIWELRAKDNISMYEIELEGGDIVSFYAYRKKIPIHLQKPFFLFNFKDQRTESSRVQHFKKLLEKKYKVPLERLET